MSHVSNVDCKIRDLDALEIALEGLGGVLVRDQQQFKYYAGAKAPCIHAIHRKGAASGYEIGLRYRSPEEQDTFTLHCDFYDGALTRAFGANLEGLQNEYLAVVAQQQLSGRGYRVAIDRTQGQVQVVGML